MTRVDLRLRIVDDLLDEGGRRALWELICARPMAPLHREGWIKAWRLTDGEPMAGGVVHSAFDRGAGSAEQGVAVYPTGTAVDALFDAVGAVARETRFLEAWRLFTGRSFAYRIGTGLSWHSEHAAFAGSWVFFAHPEWHADWGGALLVAEGVHGFTSSAGTIGLARHPAMAAALLDDGVGRYVLPRPNRLVILGGGVPHMVTPVRPPAGDRARVSVAGFFVR